MVLSTRILIAWGSAAAAEDTVTLVMLSPQGRFVDLRFRPAASPDSFPFELATCGEEEDRGDGSVAFPTWVNLVAVVDGAEVGADVGYFSGLPNGDRKEVGEMRHPDTGVVTPYVEVWRSLDPVATTPDAIGSQRETGPGTAVACRVYDSREGVVGRVVVLGRWLQGCAVVGGAMACLRAWQRDDGSWEDVVSYGDTLVFVRDPRESVGLWTLVET